MQIHRGKQLLDRIGHHTVTGHWRDVRSLAVTVVIALGSAFVCHRIGTPAPYLLGSLFGTWIAGGMVAPLRPYLGIPRNVHIVTVTGLGVLVGAMFNPDIFDQLGTWMVTVVSMIGATLVATVAGYQYLTRLRKYPPMLALLCCLPGGQAEIVAVSREMVEKDYVVALCHLVRVATVFCATPLLLTLMHGRGAVQASNAVLDNLPGILDVSATGMLLFFGLAVAGYYLARLLRIPMPHLLGPLILSSALHMLGIVHVPRISEFVMLAQVVIGGAIGARLAQVPARELAGYLRDALCNALLVITTYIVIAVALSGIIDRPVTDLLLSFVPGGLYEVTLLALLFGFDVAFVTFHHTVRVLLIFFMLPGLVSRMPNRRQTPSG